MNRRWWALTLEKMGTLFASFFLIITLTFVMMKTLPGDPFAEEQALPPEIHAALIKHYGLDDPLLTQYGRYLSSILRWDFGPSFKFKDRSVNAIINETAPISALLGLEALAIALAGGLLLGTIAALREHQWQDGLAMVVATLGISVPSFILASLLQYIFGLKLGLLPVARWGTFAQSILPAIALAALPLAFIARLTRANILEVLRHDYIRTARSKGLTEGKILRSHILRNALLPLLPYLGQLATAIMTGSFIIEKIFAIPGLGRWFVHSISGRDYTVIMGTTVFYSIMLLTMVFVMDIAYALLDPRFKEDSLNGR